ncbi:MAG: PEP-CTERM sorting domain-containing protein [Acidobacteriota bacterium]
MARILIALCVCAIPVLAGITITPVPEPSTMLLMGGGLAALGLIAGRRRRK